MAKQTNNHSIANKFEKDFNYFIKALKKENAYDGENYTDILKGGKLTRKGNEIKNQWKNYRDYLKSKDLTEKYPPESSE